MNKINIWKQIEVVLKNDAISLKQKEILIKNLRRIVLKSADESICINPQMLNDIKSVIEKFYPDLFRMVELEILNSKRRWLKQMPSIVGESVNIIFILLITSLNTKQFVSKTVLITHLTFYLDQFVKYNKQDNLTDSDCEILNNIFNDSITQDLHPSQVNVSNMSDSMKVTWKFVLLLVEILVKKNFLIEASTLDFRASDLTHEYVPSTGTSLINTNRRGRGRINETFNSPHFRKKSQKPYPVTTIALAETIKANTGELTTFFFSKWPQLVPDTPEDITNNRHIILRKGVSKLVMGEDLKKYLLIASSAPITFNYDLFTTVLDGKIEDKLFNEYRERSYQESSRLVYENAVLYKKMLYVVKNILKLQTARSIYQYFSEAPSSVTYKYWIETIFQKVLGVKRRKKCKKAYEKSLRLSLDFSDIDFSTADHIIKFFFEYLIKYFDVAKKPQHHSEFILNFKKTTEIGDSKIYNDLETHINTITNVINDLGLNRLLNFGIISKLYSQKEINIFEIHNERIYNMSDISDLEIEFLQEHNLQYKKYLELQSNYSLNLNISFKKKLMALYNSKSFFYSQSVGANGRLVIEGFAPHAHSGKMFRFNETRPEIVKPSNIKHIKRAISFSFKNVFNSFEEHEEWVDTNFDEIVKDKHKTLEIFIYVEAYLKVLDNKPIGTFIRLDHVASAITIWGLIANCSESKKATNITFDGCNQYQPYTYIAKKCLEPALKKLKMEWAEKIDSNSLKQDKMIFQILNKVLLPNVLQKKLSKSLIMPHVYGLTTEGVKDIISDFVNSTNPDFRCSLLKDRPMFTQLSYKIFHALNRFSPATTKIRNIMKTTEKRIIGFIEGILRNKKGINADIIYSNVIKQEDGTWYWDYKVKKKYAWNVYDPEKGYSNKKVFMTQTKNSDVNENTTTLSPLFIHSGDGAIYRRTTILCSHFDTAGVHDCLMTHANNVDELVFYWKQAICEILGGGEKTNKEYIENIWLNPTLEHIRSYLNKGEHIEEMKKIDQIKELWNNQWEKYLDLEAKIDVSDVKSSKYNISYE